MSATENPDLSFAEFVRVRKAVQAARLREGAFYAYAGDRRVRETLGSLRPVRLATEAAFRQLQGTGRPRLLADAVPVDERSFPALHQAVLRAGATLGIESPATFVSGAVSEREVRIVGIDADAFVVVPGALLDALTSNERLALLGHAFGHVHNDHAAFLSTLAFLESVESGLGRIAARPAVAALLAWRERALVTADRASLLVARDLDAVAGTLFKTFVGAALLFADVDVGRCLAAVTDGVPPGNLRVDRDGFRAVCRRIRALRVFAETTFYRAGLTEAPAAAAGFSLSACDERCEDILAEDP